MKDYKTTICGICLLLVAIGNFGAAIFDNDPNTVANLEPLVAAIISLIAGVGCVLAADSRKVPVWLLIPVLAALPLTGCITTSHTDPLTGDIVVTHDIDPVKTEALITMAINSVQRAYELYLMICELNEEEPKPDRIEQFMNDLERLSALLTTLREMFPELQK